MTSRAATRRQHSQTQANEVFAYRRSALLHGIGIAIAMILGGILLTCATLYRVEVDIPAEWQPVVFLTVPAIVLTGIGAFYWHLAKRDDEVHHRFQKVPELPLALVRDHDDAWIEGAIRCPKPLVSPGVVKSCSWYHVVVERRRYSGKDSYWEVTRDEERGTTIWITDSMREIEVDTTRATIDYPTVVKRESSDTRITLRYLRAHGSASACGLVRYRHEVLGLWNAMERDRQLAEWLKRHRKSQVEEEPSKPPTTRRERLRAAGRAIRERKKKGRVGVPRNDWHTRSLDDAHDVPQSQRLMLTPSRKVPMLVTPMRRATWHDRSEADEIKYRVKADVLLGYGIPVTTWAAGARFELWEIAFSPGIPIGLLLMLALLLPARVVRLYNQLIAYRLRIRNAAADLQADEKMRYDLVPQLATVVQAAAKHERDVQELLAQLRSEADATSTVLALRERHPELSAAPNFTALADDLTAIEEKLAFGRAHLRDTISEYDTLRQRFPNLLLAAATGFREVRLQD